MARRGGPGIVALTGGPGGGKSTLLRELREGDLAGERWVFVPEAAPMLFANGLNARDESFEPAVVRLQCELEMDASRGAGPDRVVVCHRGALDAFAYWLDQGREASRFFAAVELSWTELADRYHAVLHLETAARGAVEHYRRWPDAHRPESADEAVAIDRRCAEAWQQHRRYAFVANTGIGWTAKAGVAKDYLNRWLFELVDNVGGMHGDV